MMLIFCHLWWLAFVWKTTFFGVGKEMHELSIVLFPYFTFGFREIVYWMASCFAVRLACGRVLEECLSLNNREYVVNKGYLKKLVATAEKLNKNPEQQRMSLSIMESLFKHSTATTYRYVQEGSRELGILMIFCRTTSLFLMGCTYGELDWKGQRNTNMNVCLSVYNVLFQANWVWCFGSHLTDV